MAHPQNLTQKRGFYQAWLHKSAQVEMAVTQAPLLIFFRGPKISYRQFRFAEGRSFQDRMSSSASLKVEISPKITTLLQRGNCR